MSGWKTNDLKLIEVKIKIPKNTVAFVVNTLSQEKNGELCEVSVFL